MTEHAKLLPGKAHSPAGSVGVTEDASGNGLAEGLQHVLQLLLVHGHGQVWDVKVGGVLLLLLNGEKQGEDSRMRIRTSPFKKKQQKPRSHRKSCWQELCEMYDSWMSWQVQDITVWEKRVWNWRWISLWPCMRERELRERRESRSSEMEEIVFWLGWTSAELLSRFASLWPSRPLSSPRSLLSLTPLSCVITTLAEDGLTVRLASEEDESAGSR